MRVFLAALLLAAAPARIRAAPDLFHDQHAAPAAPAGREADAILRDHLWRQVLALPKHARPKVGLVLSAGAVRAVAHIGVLQVLEDTGFPIDIVVGTSMGAVIGALYAAGLDMDTLRTLPSHLKLSSGSNFNTVRMYTLLINDSLMSTENLEAALKNWIGDKRFDQVEKTFACVAMDLRTGEKIIFRDGSIGPAVRASMNLPGLFKPVLYRHRYLVDGGVVDYVPVDAAKLLGAEWTIASVTQADFTQSQPTNVFSTLEQIFDIRGSLLARQQQSEADVVIEPDVGTVRYYEVARAAEVMQEGMRAAGKRVPAAQESLILFTLPKLWRRWTSP